MTQEEASTDDVDAPPVLKTPEEETHGAGERVL
jgi:hypothetical protein